MPEIPPLSSSAPIPHPRSHIYYWKCDRSAAFHGTDEKRNHALLEPVLLEVLKPHAVGKTLTLRAAGGQGNHLTWHLQVGRRHLFVRVEDGPEQDDYLEVESRILDEVRHLSIPAPKVHLVDASRTEVPFAWHVMDYIDSPDLNHWYKLGKLDLVSTASEIGAAIAKWQAVPTTGFGPFSPAMLRDHDDLAGFHPRYEDYFLMYLEKHLYFLADENFLTEPEVEDIRTEMHRHQKLLDLGSGCLVHKDLALWNILGTKNSIAAYIDWDDAISGDPMDDLSLLACFHDAPVLEAACRGYATVRPLPENHQRRFWMHLLRNMIVKSVIRVGAGYFDRTDGFFLIGSGSSGADLQKFTRERLFRALQGLREGLEVTDL